MRDKLVEGAAFAMSVEDRIGKPRLRTRS